MGKVPILSRSRSSVQTRCGRGERPGGLDGGGFLKGVKGPDDPARSLPDHRRAAITRCTTGASPNHGFDPRSRTSTSSIGKSKPDAIQSGCGVDEATRSRRASKGIGGHDLADHEATRASTFSRGKREFQELGRDRDLATGRQEHGSRRGLAMQDDSHGTVPGHTRGKLVGAKKRRKGRRVVHKRRNWKADEAARGDTSDRDASVTADEVHVVLAATRCDPTLPSTGASTRGDCGDVRSPVSKLTSVVHRSVPKCRVRKVCDRITSLDTASRSAVGIPTGNSSTASKRTDCAGEGSTSSKTKNSGAVGSDLAATVAVGDRLRCQ